MIGLLGLFLDQAGHRHRAAGGNFQRGFGTAGLDRGNRRFRRCRLIRELSLETSDTSVITCRLIRPSVSTTGVKLSEIPNFLKLTVWTQFPIAPPVVVWQVTPVGIGNSPPEMNVADLPETAVRLGSASVRTTPALSIARNVAWTDGVEPKAVGQRIAGDQRGIVGGERVRVAEGHRRGAVIQLADRSMPICLTIDRATSATVTLSITWSCRGPRSS